MQEILKNIELNNLWNRYNEVRISGDKKNANILLSDFISKLNNESKESINSFVEKICESVLSEPNIISNNGIKVSSDRVRIQHQLFNEIILPVLIDAYKNNSAIHIRWIAQLEQFFYSDKRTSSRFLTEIRVEGFFETIFFLKKSYSILPNQFTLELLLRRMYQNIGYDIHEVPLGVFSTPNEFDETLADFEYYYNQFENKADWKERLKEAKLIALHWRKYIDNKNKFSNFENYLKLNSVELE